MSEQVLVVSASTQIARAIDVVRRHFSDVQHHVRNPVHPGVEFTPIADADGECRFHKTIRILAIPIADEVVLKRQPDGSITEDSVRAGDPLQECADALRENFVHDPWLESARSHGYVEAVVPGFMLRSWRRFRLEAVGPPRSYTGLPISPLR